MPHVDILALFWRQSTIWRESEDFELFFASMYHHIIIIIIIHKSAPRATPCSAVRVCAKNLKHHVLIPMFNSWPNCHKKFEILAITHETQRPKICRGYCTAQQLAERSDASGVESVRFNFFNGVWKQ